MSIPRIAVIKNEKFKSESIAESIRGYRYLKNLHEDNIIDLCDEDIGVKNDGSISIPKTIKDCDAVLCRPLWGGMINSEHVKALSKDFEEGGKFVVATLSAGTSHIHKEIHKSYKVICSDGGNSDQTAEMTLYMAISLRRQLHFDLTKMAFGSFDRGDANKRMSLRNATWTLVGCGNVAQSLMRRLIGLGLQRIIVRNHKMTLRRFENVFKDLSVVSWISRSDSNPCVVVGASKSGPSCVIEGTIDLEYALRNTDILSIHVPLLPPDPKTKKGGTENFINKKGLSHMKKTAIIINSSRYGIVNEKDVVEALIRGELSGYGSDVIEPEAENENAGPATDKKESFIWQAYVYNVLRAMEQDEGIKIAGMNTYSKSMTKIFHSFIHEKKLESDLHNNQALNILLTPHVGGSTIEAEDDIATEVIGELLIELGLEKYVDFYTSTRTKELDKESENVGTKKND